ncbi:hypothetical protein GGI11_004632 [Coemansia sp. RSA 2049]|nr:hypothetical protein GGI11_004632 [Coemansia sp. RSA 2049]
MTATATTTTTTTTTDAGPLFLGLDLSTQQLKGMLINKESVVEQEINILFDDEFPAYQTQNGRHVSGDRVTAPVLMWVEAIDLLMAKIRQTGQAGRIRGISGAAQQHGSVYWRPEGVQAIGALDATVALADQLAAAGAFALENSPIWEDSSTRKQCEELETLAGGPAHLAQITGSVAYERFTGTQIAKIKETQPEVWQTVARISLVSSFIASVLAGRIAPVDAGDASGTNIYDMQRGTWAPALCDAIDPTLIDRLGAEVVMANHCVGPLATYFVQRHGFHPECSVIAFTGDNLSAYSGFESLFAASASTQAPAIVSLGTSDTVLFPLERYPYAGDASLIPASHLGGHVLQHPTERGRYIAMLCYKNGSLARDWVRRTSFGAQGSWDEYTKAALDACPMAPHSIGFYYLQMEILPRAKGIHRFEENEEEEGRGFQSVDKFRQGSDACAIIESQVLAMRADYSHKSDAPLSAVAITGGASRNPALLKIIADVLNVRVFAVCAQKGAEDEHGADVQNPAMPAYGGAVRALQHWRTTSGGSSSDVSAAAPAASGYVLQQVCSPDAQTHALYSEALHNYEHLRDQVSKSSKE